MRTPDDDKSGFDRLVEIEKEVRRNPPPEPDSREKLRRDEYIDPDWKKKQRDWSDQRAG